MVSMIRKYHKLLTNIWHREEEPPTNYETLGRQTQQSKHLSLSYQDDCKARTITDSHNRGNNRITALERTAA